MNGGSGKRQVDPEDTAGVNRSGAAESSSTADSAVVGPGPISQGSKPSPHPANPSGSSQQHGSSHSSGVERPVVYDQATVISKRPPPESTGSAGSSTRTELSQSLVGERLDHFELLSFLGGGGMGAVFRALDTRLNRMVALKILSRDQTVDEEAVRRFRNEAQSVARCDHENIARVFYVGEDRGLHYIAFELIEGTNIRDLVDQFGPLPISDVISYTLQIAEALAHASSRDVVHRDIKPSNIIVTEKGQAKLVDMGLARMHPLKSSGDDLTASGVTLGTFDYISPEQARDPRNVDVRSDIYSLGCTVYFMFTARPPFPEGTVLQKLLQHQGDTPPDPREFNPDLPDDLTRVINKMMAKDPRRRYQDAEELISDLLLLANQLGVALPQAPRWAWEPPGSRRLSRFERHLPWLVPVVSLLLIVVVLHFNSSPMPPAGSEAADHGPEPLGPRIAIANRDPASGQTAVLPDSHPPTATEPPSEPISPVESTIEKEKRPQPSIRDDTATTASANSSSNAPGTSGDSQAAEQPALHQSANASDVAHDAEQPPPSEPLRAGLELTKLAASVTSDPQNTSAELSVASAELPGGSDRPIAATPDTVKRDPIRHPPADRLVLLGRGGNADRAYATLRAASAAAEDGDVIELRYSGRRVEAPLDVNNIGLTIRAAPGFNPTIVFLAAAVDSLDGRRTMISVAGGQLQLAGVDLEFDVSRDATAESWALFELRRADQLTLQRCWLTIRNASDQLTAYHPQVAFIETHGIGAGQGMSTIGQVVPNLEPIRVTLQQCVVRGEAIFLRGLDLMPIELSWDNGLLLTPERFLTAGNGPVQPAQEAKLRVDLRHVTLVARRGVGLFSDNRDHPYLLATHVKIADSIVRTDEHIPFFEHVGVSTAEQFRHELSWQFDHVFSRDGRPVFWKIRGMTKQGLPDVRTLPSWRSFLRGGMAELPHFGVVVWRRLPSLDLPFHEQSPTDYVLDQGSAGRPSAYHGASDGRDAGFDLELLPKSPAVQEAPGDDKEATADAARN